MRFICAIVTFLLMLNIFCSAQSLKGDASSPVDLRLKIKEIVDPLAKSNNFSGSVFIEKDGDEIFNESYGFLNRERGTKHNAKSRFFLASVSAMFTATAVMRLVDQKKLSLDDPLSKFVPGITNGDKMTIEILLTERSGIPRIGSQGKVNYDTLTRSAQTTDDLIDMIKALKPAFEPGEKYEHSRSSYILLTRVIEKVSGKTFGKYLREDVFIPLGMRNSGHFGYSEKIGNIPNLATGYVQKDVTDLALAPVLHWSSKTGHASIYSTAEDLGKFATAALENNFLSPDSWKRIQSSHFGDNVGYGVFTSPQGTHKRFYMSGGSPGFSTFFAVYPDEKLVVIMLSNIQIFVPYFTVPTLASVVFGEPYTRLNLVTPPDVEENLVKTLIGRYKFGEDFYRPNGTVIISAEGKRLFADGGPLIPINEGKGEFTKFIHRQYWSTLEFVKDESGKIIGLKFDSFSGTRIK